MSEWDVAGADEWSQAAEAEGGWPQAGALTQDYPAAQDYLAAADDQGTPGSAPAVAAASLGPVDIQQASLPDGTTAVHVGAEVTNGGVPAAQGELLLVIKAISADGAAEQDASHDFQLAPFAAGEKRTVGGPVQLDAGSWNLTLELWSSSAGAPISTQPATVHVAGRTHGHPSALAPTAEFDVDVRITGVTHEGGNVYRVHYDLINMTAHAVPAGLDVLGSLSGDVADSSQSYQLQSGLPPYGHAPHYLTLESRPVAGTITAQIMVQPAHERQKVSTVDVDLDKHGAVLQMVPR